MNITTMRNTTGIIALAATLSLPAYAETDSQEFPDVRYGMWETTTVTSMRSDAMNLPESTNTTSACVTEDDVREGRAFLQDQDECEILEQDITSTSMDMTMICAQPDAGEIRMTVSMKYSGDTATGVMEGEMDSPMGKMFMTIKIDSRRTGDC